MTNVPISDIQEYMTLLDCHSTSATELAQNPQVVRCNTCGLYRFSPRMNREGQIFYFRKLNDEDAIADGAFLVALQHVGATGATGLEPMEKQGKK